MKYILLKRSYATGSYGRHLNFHKGWFCEVKAKQRIQGIEFTTKGELELTYKVAITDIANIADESVRQDYRVWLTNICKSEFEKFIAKPTFTNLKKCVKNVAKKVRKNEKFFNLKTIKEKTKFILIADGKGE